MTTYIDDGPQTTGCRVTWYDVLIEHLTWCYGGERTVAILSGRDPATQADLARWRALGRRPAA